MEHQATEVSYAGEEVTVRCSCGFEATAEGSDSDTVARAALDEHLQAVSE